MTENAAFRRLRELHEAATPGPWAWKQHERGPWQIGTVADPDDETPIAGFIESFDDVVPIDFICESGDEKPAADAALIVAARNLLPLLLDVAEAAHRVMNPTDDGRWRATPMYGAALDTALAALESAAQENA